jgi:hypothetical protein
MVNEWLAMGGTHWQPCEVLKRLKSRKGNLKYTMTCQIFLNDLRILGDYIFTYSLIYSLIIGVECSDWVGHMKIDPSYQ